MNSLPVQGAKLPAEVSSRLGTPTGRLQQPRQRPGLGVGGRGGILGGRGGMLLRGQQASPETPKPARPGGGYLLGLGLSLLAPGPQPLRLGVRLFQPAPGVPGKPEGATPACPGPGCPAPPPVSSPQRDKTYIGSRPSWAQQFPPEPEGLV